MIAALRDQTGMQRVTQAMGAVTAAYGGFVIAAPRVFARQLGYDGPGEPSSAVRIVCASLGARDVVSGVSMIVAPPGKARWAALGARCVADLSDAVVFGTLLPSHKARTKVAFVAAGWGVLCGLSGLLGSHSRSA
jgi:hypothetical protein